VLGYEAAELKQAVVRGVRSRSTLRGVDGGFADSPGGNEVRLANAEGYNPIHLRDQIEKPADA